MVQPSPKRLSVRMFSIMTRAAKSIPRGVSLLTVTVRLILKFDMTLRTLYFASFTSYSILRLCRVLVRTISSSEQKPDV